ncbi:MAG: hypothetical protein PHQ43_14800 [Dehalococcoidales bacterium]|nr:hypothetical protein [Dehalococcoidales bacterium]
MTRTDMIKIAVTAVNNTMDPEQRLRGNEWVGVAAEEHARHAFNRLKEALDPRTAPAERKTSLAHALTRIAMALTVGHGEDYHRETIGGVECRPAL